MQTKTNSELFSKEKTAFKPTYKVLFPLIADMDLEEETVFCLQSVMILSN